MQVGLMVAGSIVFHRITKMAVMLLMCPTKKSTICAGTPARVWSAATRVVSR